MTTLPPDVISLGDAAARVLARVSERQEELTRELEHEAGETAQAIAENARRLSDLTKLGLYPLNAQPGRGDD